MSRQGTQTAEPIQTSRSRTWGRSLLDVARRKPLGTAGAVVTLLLILSAVLAPLIAPFDPYDFNLTDQGLPLRQQAPNGEFLFGTDALGRDVLSRIIYGARVSLLVGFLSVALGTTVGTAIGLASGFWGGKVDQVLQRIVDTFMAFPGIVLALAVIAVLGQSLMNIILVIAIVIAPGTSRVIRGAVLSV